MAPGKSSVFVAAKARRATITTETGSAILKAIGFSAKVNN
jgi:hypothetical protein